MTVNNQPNPFEYSEADTCREYVTPAIQSAGWGDHPCEIANSILLPTRIKLDKPKIEPASATRQFWTDWATQTPKPDAVSKAVEALRRQVR